MVDPLEETNPQPNAPLNLQPTAQPTARANVLSLVIKDKAVLYATYISWIKQGGLFIPTDKPYELGEQISIVLQLMEETEKHTLTGKVVWITPPGAQGNRAAGIGIQFQGEEGSKVHNKIVTYLAGALKSDRPTHTM
jgi:type IV pilus assembly protein PilZ